MHANTHTHTCTHTHANTHTHTCTHTHANMHTHTCTHTHAHTHTHAYIYTRTQLHTYTCDLVLFLYFTSAVPCIPITNMHAHAHTHTHSQHLLDIGGCVSLARPLATFCCQRLTTFFELDQKLHKLQPLPPTPVDKPVVIKKEPGTESMEIGEEEDKDSVFTDGTSGHGGATVKQEPGEPKLPNSTPSGRPSSVSSGGRSRAPSSSGATLTANQPNGDGEAPVISANDPKPAQFHWCTHHSSLMVQLFCIVQTIAVKCPTAFVHIRSHRSSAPSKPLVAASPLTLLPVGLAELPMPHSISPELRKKVVGQPELTYAIVGRRLTLSTPTILGTQGLLYSLTLSTPTILG